MPQHPRTFADVIEALALLSGLPDRTRRDLQSAVRCFCSVAGLDPGVANAGDLGALQARLATLQPELAGVNARRWGVVRSQLLRALNITGAARPLQTATTRLTPAWETLISGIPKIRHRLALSRFGRFCVQQGMEPAAVTQQTFDQYGAALRTESLVRNPASVHREAVLAWSQLPEHGAGASPAPVVVAPTGTARARGRHPLTDFPGSFAADIAAFRAWCQTADPLDDSARPKALRPQTVISYTSSLHTAADAAVRGGIPIARIGGIAVLTEPDVYKAILRQMLADHEGKPSAHAEGVATVLPIVARDWLKQSPDQIAELKRLKAKLPKRHPGLTPKNRELLARFNDQALLGRFLGLGDELWQEARTEKLPRNQRLVRAQMALLIGILQIVPLRRKNLCALTFDTHITWPNGPAGSALIQIPSDEGKTEMDYVGELPPDLSRRLHHYRNKLAPALVGHVPNQLFVDIEGKFKSQAGVTTGLVNILRKRLGIHMTAHQARHVAAKLLLDAHPAAYEAAAQLLGHKGTKNIVRFYGGVDTQRATRHHGKLIERLREETRTSGRRARRG